MSWILYIRYCTLFSNSVSTCKLNPLFTNVDVVCYIFQECQETYEECDTSNATETKPGEEMYEVPNAEEEVISVWYLPQ